ncbi:MAG: EamA family transporter [Burkholderiales bacterium]|nr:EamA family transporter [Burkholderiales bacterium]
MRRFLLAGSLFATWVIWGSTYLAIKLTLVALPPFLMSGLRYLAAAGIMLAMSRLVGEPWASRRALINAATGGGLALAIGNGAVCVAEQTSPSGLVSVVMAATPLLTVLLNRLLRERTSGRAWLGVCLGLGGVALLQAQSNLSGDPKGLVIMLGGALAWAVASVMLPRLTMPEALTSSAIQMAGGGVFSLLFSAIAHEHATGPLAGQALGALLYLILAGSLLGYTGYLWLLRHTQPALATSFFCVNPVVALLLGYLLGGEPLSLVMLGGVAVVLVGILLVITCPAAASADTGLDH